MKDYRGVPFYDRDACLVDLNNNGFLGDCFNEYHSFILYKIEGFCFGGIKE